MEKHFGRRKFRFKPVNNGSKSLFQNFITDNVSPWVARLTLACSCLGVDVVEGDAFLGRGAHGRVFKGGCGLKIVEKCSVLHSSGLVHGDPRVPNVILHGEKLLWIDLVEVMEASYA
ncbi:TPA: hypothetical protein N0F65_001882 [Lagenidium giganteum]|uniref:Uncharacterized protein n=1 Tax=Lagenidium giganteum TaxID=4803 RepID=A0AAV2YZR5_9STRA|nr:TPA: hypothetical protein N0F65_001882 [Lagenidium giganteum]